MKNELKHSRVLETISRRKFPPDIPSHNNFQVGGEQTFYFNEKGLLQSTKP